MRTLGEALTAAGAALARGGIEAPRRRARQLAAAATGLSASDVFAQPERALTAAEDCRIAAILARLLADEPLSRILGRREFWGLDFALSAATLDPRPESETLVEAVLRRLPDRARPWRLLDLGTGTGCLLLALLSELPRAVGIGVDIAPEALRTARANASSLGLGERARFLAGDWGRAIAGRFDVVVANPPYIASADLAALPRAVGLYDPRAALDGGGSGLDAYREIARDLARLLDAEGALAALEIGLGQAPAVAAVLCDHGIALEAVEDDLAGIPRCLVARLRGPAKGGEHQKLVGMARGPV